MKKTWEDDSTAAAAAIRGKRKQNGKPSSQMEADDQGERTPNNFMPLDPLTAISFGGGSKNSRKSRVVVTCQFICLFRCCPLCTFIIIIWGALELLLTQWHYSSVPPSGKITFAGNNHYEKRFLHLHVEKCVSGGSLKLPLSFSVIDRPVPAGSTPCGIIELWLGLSFELSQIRHQLWLTVSGQNKNRCFRPTLKHFTAIQSYCQETMSTGPKQYVGCRKGSFSCCVVVPPVF